MGRWPFGHQRNTKGTAYLPERKFWKIIREQIIFRIYDLITYVYRWLAKHRNKGSGHSEPL